MNLFNRNAAARNGPAAGFSGKAMPSGVATPKLPVAEIPVAMESAAPASSAKRDEMFDKLSRMFRRAGTDVTAQALFRAVMEYRVEALEKDK
jgi:hypothetical protein